MYLSISIPSNYSDGCHDNRKSTDFNLYVTKHFGVDPNHNSVGPLDPSLTVRQGFAYTIQEGSVHSPTKHLVSAYQNHNAISLDELLD